MFRNHNVYHNLNSGPTTNPCNFDGPYFGIAQAIGSVIFPPLIPFTETIPTINEIITKSSKPITHGRKTIPKIIKSLVWDTYIGKQHGTSPCLCCKTNIIDQMNFHCGHIISVRDGGANTIENLKPICSSCNLSMNTQNMNLFMKQYGFT